MSMDTARKLLMSMQVDEDEKSRMRKADTLGEKNMVYMKRCVLYTLITFDEAMTLMQMDIVLSVSMWQHYRFEIMTR